MGSWWSWIIVGMVIFCVGMLTLADINDVEWRK